ncbi:GAF domain-containing protein [Actinoplanes teichomyceticus]|uniref:histidine kinase n=1 Tax=Actinoplanes teichomyceticus TaxID=1867 RepID=A0A561VS51_ACTTI|nr:GAF domain-containing protein [Actinoplanes teichomyceticus]TWG14444.1 PAS domain S-box-containing protein [Actinoplanes teichomyceticus]GIF16245.1 hypothetical protein Ate01nite_62770 [Actinoplanes teichomyceticus]
MTLIPAPAPEAAGRVTDPRRLAVLRSMGLATESVSPGLDRLTAMAARLLDVPVSLASVVEHDRQWFASVRGIPEPWASARQTPLTYSFCQHVVDADAPLVVADARGDPRLRDNLAVTEWSLVAYAGNPLRAPDGTLLGAFCVGDTAPRQWSAEDLLLLDDLAAVAATEIAAQVHAARLSRANEQAEQTTRDLERQELFLQALLDSLDTGVAACDPEGRLVMFNRAMRESLGSDADPSLTPREWAARLRALHPGGEPFAVGEMPLIRALNGEHVRGVNGIMVGRDGSQKWYSTHAHPILSRTGELLGAVSASHEITERRRAERFRDTELAVHRVFAAATDTAAAAPAVLEAVITTLGWAHAELWLADDLTGLLYPVGTWTSPEHPTTVTVPASISRGFGLAGTAWDRDEPVWVPDAATDPAPLSEATALRCGLRTALAVPVHGGDRAIGALTAFGASPATQDASCVALLSGVAAQIGEFVQRRRADDLAQQLTRAQDEYIALAGHELRTPLTSILSSTGLLEDIDPDTPVGEVQDLIHMIGRNTAHMRNVIDGLLDLAALDSGHIELDRQPVDLAHLVRDACTAAAGRAADLGITVHTALPDHLPVSGSAHRLRQLVDNLLSNAVKYCIDGGRVEVALQTRDGVAQLSVTDTGIGIPAADRDHVFRRLYRSPNAVQHAIPGAGLGLALCSAITARHHGTIALAPADGQGTTVVVRIPEGLAHRPPAAAAARP